MPKNTMSRKVKFVSPAKLYSTIKDEIDAAYFDVMNKGALIDQQHLKDFETNPAKFVGTKYAVWVNSGYDALMLSVKYRVKSAADEVIVPAHTFVASCSAIVNAGAKPVHALLSAFILFILGLGISLLMSELDSGPPAEEIHEGI